MKFYKYKPFIFSIEVAQNKLGEICYHSKFHQIYYFINGFYRHNIKRASYIYKKDVRYYLSGNWVGSRGDFKSNKEWRKHIKLLVFS